MTNSDSMAVLQVEVTRLVWLLEANGIEWRLPSTPLLISLSGEAIILHQFGDAFASAHAWSDQRSGAG